MKEETFKSPPTLFMNSIHQNQKRIQVENRTFLKEVSFFVLIAQRVGHLNYMTPL